MPARSRTASLGADALARAMVANRRWAERLGWGRYADAVATLVGSASSNPGGRDLAVALARWQKRRGLVPDGILGPRTFAVVQAALAPPTTPTGVVPADAPPVPDGLDAVIATFGDPRPLLGSDGALTPENVARWERQTLARGRLPFAIPLDARRPDGPAKQSFYAHRKLVGVFEMVFGEIERLGMRPEIHSWGGIYNFRPIRGGSGLSLHAFGAAIDLNAETNPLGQAGDISPRVVDIFRHFGFFWGGDFRGRPDPMHFQYATGY